MNDGKIVKPLADQSKAKVIDCKNAIIAPGFIDLQINGGFGVDFTSDIKDAESCIDALQKVGSGILSHGVTSYCPTIVTSPSKVFHQSLKHIKKQVGGESGAQVLGVHLEGPFISFEKKGAHNKDHLKELGNGMADIRTVYGDDLDDVSIVTLAPEIPGSENVIKSLTDMRIQVSIGHSTSGFEEGKRAVKNGARLVTHLFNGMKAFHHRDPGLLGLFLEKGENENDIWFGIIADGVHTHPLAIKLAYKVNFPSLVLVTDAIRAMGFKDGIYRSGQQNMEVKGLRATVVGTDILIGSVVTMHKSILNMIEFTGCSVVEALEAASLHPAMALGIHEQKGTLEVGSDADFVIINSKDLSIISTWIEGKCVFDAAMR